MTLLSSLRVKRRLNLAIPQSAVDRLDWLQARTDAASHTEVIRNALFVYEILVERLATGSKLMELTAKGDLFPLAVAIDVKPPQLVAIKPDSDFPPAHRPARKRTRGVAKGIDLPAESRKAAAR